MSASEKLKALESRRDVAIIQGSPEFKAYWNALPQIVAVVEAATELAEESFERMAAADLKAWNASYEIVYPGEQVEKYRAALAALEAALT